jgi:phosphatidylinositol glycan class F
MGKPKKKSVSFEKAQGDTEDVGKVTSESTKKASKGAIPQLKNRLVVFPLHNIIVVITMFHLGLVNNVYETMMKGFVTLASLQVVYNYILLQNQADSKKSKQNTNGPLLIFGSIVISILLVVPLYVLLVILGAPFMSYTKETLALCLHLSLLVFNPLLVLYKFDFNQFKLLFVQDKIYNRIFTHPILSASLMVIITTWLGVIPIPLDWDRPWQQWPITLLVGGYLGTIIGSIISIAMPQSQ